MSQLTPIFDFTDSVDHYVDSQLGLKWGNLFNAHVTSSGRIGQGISITQGFIVPGSIIINLNPFASWQCGFAFNLGQSGGVAPGGIIAGVQSNPGAGDIVRIRIANDNTVYVVAVSSPEIVLGVGPVLQWNTWYYIEYIAIITLGVNPTDPISITSGLRVDGVVWVNLTTVTSTIQTQQCSSLINAAGCSSGGKQQGGTVTIDDFYAFHNPTAVAMSGTFGDVSIQCSFPNGDTANTTPPEPHKWLPLPSPPAIHYTLVNDNPPDGLSSFISFTPNLQSIPPDRTALDFYTYQTLISTDNLYAVNMLFMGIGNEAICGIVGQQGATPTYWTSGAIAAHWTPSIFNWNNLFLISDPYAGLPWTVSNYNSYDLGVFYPVQ